LPVSGVQHGLAHSQVTHDWTRDVEADGLWNSAHRTPKVMKAGSWLRRANSWGGTIVMTWISPVSKCHPYRRLWYELHEDFVEVRRSLMMKGIRRPVVVRIPLQKPVISVHPLLKDEGAGPTR